MDGNAQYPPPDFGCPPLNSFRNAPPPSQHPARPSNFHPSMWNWYDTPSDPWAHSTSNGTSTRGGWQGGPPPGSGGYDGDPGPGDPGHHQHQGQHFNRGWHRGRGYNNGQPNNYGKKKYKKEPEYAFFCDTCDRGFKTQEHHSEHMSQHIKCSFPDCNFTAHEKIVSLHWRNSHAPGSKRIKLDTPEEIAKWREERRRNYPTQDNIEKKRKVQDVREEGGGVLETAQFGRVRGRGRGNNRFQRGAPGGPQNHGNGAPEQPPPLFPATRDGDPLGALVNDEPDSDKEEPSGTPKQGGLVVPPKQMSSGLASLVASYGSLTESDSDEEPQALPIQRANQLVQENQALLQTIPQDTEAPLGSHPRAPPQGPYRGRGAQGRGRGGRGRGRRGGHHMTPQKRATLLEMLLAPDIRHERNVLLQCVRYVVRSAFFGLESKPQDQQASTADNDVRKGETTNSGCQEAVAGPDGQGPQSARAANEEECQTGSTKAAATLAQEVSAEEPQVDCPGTSEMEVDANGDKSSTKETGESEQTTINPSDSEEKQSSEQVECVPMAEETPTDKDPNIATTAAEEVTPAGVYDDDVWEY
ncbi:Nuclear fragile X mental retardation-interacting protein 1 [Merluccius polli]|uniref:Nuclear fragile X mental retardation-interacting protein 1 n=1 Tax=Merluccius polli TaxID=89951 RepID=A0AA47MYF8_MERPO|nr:Nuclear fragile X mental retardation-interacting protein 1 [Merluccius polli]